MGRSIVLAAAAIAATMFLPALPRAEIPLSLGIWGGYMRAGMGDINTALQSQADGLKGLWGASPDLKKSSGGWQAGAEATMEVFGGYALGFRAGWLSPLQGRAKSVIDDSRYAPILVVTGASLVTVESWGIPVLAGGRYVAPIDEGLDFSAGLFMGYGVTGMRYAKREDLAIWSTTSGDSNSLTDYAFEADGGAFAWEAVVGFSWLAGPQAMVGLDAGYRHLSTPLKLGKDLDIDSDGKVDIAKGEQLKDAADEPVELDLSGVFFSLSLSYLL